MYSRQSLMWLQFYNIEPYRHTPTPRRAESLTDLGAFTIFNIFDGYNKQYFPLFWNSHQRLTKLNIFSEPFWALVSLNNFARLIFLWKKFEHRQFLVGTNETYEPFWVPKILRSSFLLWKKWSPVSSTILSEPRWVLLIASEPFWAPVSHFWANYESSFSPNCRL